MDVYGFLQSSANVNDLPNSEPNTIGQIITEINYNDHPSYEGLTLLESAKVTSLLAAQVDEFFHLASIKFNLPTLLEFLENLCQVSQKQVSNKQLLKICFCTNQAILRLKYFFKYIIDFQPKQ